VAAVRSAAAIALAADRIGLPIRAGIHTGEVELTHDTLSGMAVHVAARVVGKAGAGEVLVTATTRDLTADAGLEFEDRGLAELKGVPGPRMLYALRPSR
jgi:class 3 adenylate cyclase